MSKEEKKAIENLKGTYWYVGEEGLEENIKIVLNLIEKQQKEIEELKDDNKKKSIVIIEYQDLYEKLVDKIKAKIEECEKEKNIPHEMDFKAFYRIKDLKNIEIKVLQSLLDKE